jgi:hypothetical protein
MGARVGNVLPKSRLARLAYQAAILREEGEYARSLADDYLARYEAELDEWEDEALAWAAEADRREQEYWEVEHELSWAEQVRYDFREYLRSFSCRGGGHNVIAPRRGPRRRGAGRPAHRRSSCRTSRGDPDSEEPEPPWRRPCNRQLLRRCVTHPEEGRWVMSTHVVPKRRPLEARFEWRAWAWERSRALQALRARDELARRRTARRRLALDVEEVA